MRQPIAVIVNTSGGTAASLGEKLEATVREAFAGQDIDLRLVEGKQIGEAVKSAAGRPVVAIGGGDGTQGSAAAVFAHSETARQSPLALIGFAMRSLLGRADQERDFCTLAEAKEVVVEGSGAINVAFDGEVERMALPLTFAIMPGALKVLVPREAG